MTTSQLQALADPTRRSIFERLVAGPSSVTSLAGKLPVSRPAVSQHLKVLGEAGLVESTKDGTRRIYSVRRDGLTDLRSWLDEMWDAALDRYERAAIEESLMILEEKTLTEPVIKTRTVPLPVEQAFALFTERIGSWWPIDSHSIAADNEDGTAGTTIRFDTHVGGQVVETAPDGSECSWADVMAWQPPHRFVLSWHPSPNPIAATVLEVTFTATEVGTELRLVHSGWSEFGADADERRHGYNTGWEMVLDRYVDRVSSGG